MTRFSRDVTLDFEGEFWGIEKSTILPTVQETSRYLGFHVARKGHCSLGLCVEIVAQTEDRLHVTSYICNQLASRLTTHIAIPVKVE
jgi:hypothetical protein